MVIYFKYYENKFQNNKKISILRKVYVNYKIKKIKPSKILHKFTEKQKNMKNQNTKKDKKIKPFKRF